MTKKSSKFSKDLLDSHGSAVKGALIEFLLKFEDMSFVEPEKMKNILSLPNFLADSKNFVDRLIVQELPLAGKVCINSNKLILNLLNDEVTEFTVEFLKSAISFDAPCDTSLSLKKNKDGKYFIEIILPKCECDEMLSIVGDVMSKVNNSILDSVNFIMKRNLDLVEAILCSDTFIESYFASISIMKKTISH